MGHRLSTICTRTGDDGSTGLADGSRVGKDSTRVRLVGEIDELNSRIGFLIASLERDAPYNSCLGEIQQLLFDLGGDLNIPGRVTIESPHIEWIETWLSHFNRDLPPLKEFVLPGGALEIASCHLARTACRQAERTAVELSRETALPPSTVPFLNRISDLLFVLTRRIAHDRGYAQPLWNQARQRPNPPAD